MAKLFYWGLLALVGCALLLLLIVIIFVVLQITVNPRNHPVPFSIITGGERRINYPGDPCRDIELNSFTPSIPIVASLTTTTRIAVTKSLEQVLFNHSLQVGLDPNQLTYYGVPVSTADEVNLYVRASSISPVTQSVTVLVYDVVDFSQFLEYATNANTVYTHSLNRNCLYNVSGCTVNSIARLEGWKYFVFETTPSPSTIVVTLEATVRKYDLGVTVNVERCILDESSSNCFLSTPKRIITHAAGMGSGTAVIYLPFTITYETTPLITNSAPSSQSLNVSVDLSWTCSRTDLYGYIIVISLFSGILLIAIGFIVFMICFKCAKSGFSFSLPSVNCPRRRSSDQNVSTNVQLETITQTRSETENQKSYVRTESLPPVYDKLAKTDVKPEDELPYYQ